VAIEIVDLHKRFGREVVLDGVDLRVAAAESVAILGRSGTGKSVLLRLIAGLQEPDSGSIAIDGQNVVGLAHDRLNKIRLRLGYLFQDAALYDSLTIEENVAFPLRRQQRLPRSDRDARVQALLAEVGMAEAAKKMPADVSGGMKKRAALARALALDPDILLFDEPTAALDPITAGEINDMIVHLKTQRRLAAIVVTHDLHTARAVADRVGVSRQGPHGVRRPIRGSRARPPRRRREVRERSRVRRLYVEAVSSGTVHRDRAGHLRCGRLPDWQASVPARVDLQADGHL
jgi:phospholipid/cholesterol/gamma-HCH transport system ATP-binding protein